MVSLLRNLLAWVRRDFIWYLLVVPVLLATAICHVSAANYLGWGDSGVFKPVMEVVHPALLSGFLCLSLLRLMQSRDAAFAFLTALSAFVLSREIMGQGSSIILYAGLIGLAIYGYQQPQRIALLLRSRWATSFLGMCFVCYLSSQLLDRGMVKRIGWLVLWDTSWEPPYASNLEEALESLGGLFLLLTPLVIRRSQNPESDQADRPPKA
jgi:hypothetical protein